MFRNTDALKHIFRYISLSIIADTVECVWICTEVFFSLSSRNLAACTPRSLISISTMIGRGSIIYASGYFDDTPVKISNGVLKVAGVPMIIE